MSVLVSVVPLHSVLAFVKTDFYSFVAADRIGMSNQLERAQFPPCVSHKHDLVSINSFQLSQESHFLLK